MKVSAHYFRSPDINGVTLWIFHLLSACVGSCKFFLTFLTYIKSNDNF